MNKIIYIIIISFVFCACRSQNETQCPANRSVENIKDGKNFSIGFLSKKSMDCPANYTKPIKSLSTSESNCPANVVERETIKPEAHPTCPPAAIGAEKLLGYIDLMEVIEDKHATYKTDPVSGKKTSQAKGIRTGELEKPVKPTKEQLAYYKKKKAEEKAILKQIKHDLVEYNKEPPL